MRLKTIVLTGIAGLAAVVGVTAALAAGSAGPKITLLGAAWDGKQISVDVKIAGFKLLPDQVGQKQNAPGGGHYHIFLKGPGTGGKFKYAGAGAGATGKTGAPYAPGYVPKPGMYQVRVELANNDHSALAKPVRSNVVHVGSIRLKDAQVVMVKGKRQVKVSVAVSGYGFAPTLVGKAPTPGMGHFHIFVDGKYAGAGAGPSGTTGAPFAGDYVLPAGKHKVSVGLALNDHTALGGMSNAMMVG
ncbi:MAG: hypothetical protein U0R50_17635 [Gaiellales bacterium]